MMEASLIISVVLAALVILSWQRASASSSSPRPW